MGNASAKLLEAARRGHERGVRHALAHGADVHARSEFGCTALLAAAARGSTAVVRLLMQHGARVDEQDAAGRTALSLAAFWGHVETATELLRHGACVDAANQDGETPLMTAAARDWPQVATLLLRHGANSAARNEFGQTARHIATLLGHADTARLLQAESDATRAQNDSKRVAPPCAEAVEAAPVAVQQHETESESSEESDVHAEALGLRAEADDVLSQGGVTVWEAAKAGDMVTLRVICARHREAYHTRDNLASNSPLYYACLCGQDDAALFLLRAYTRARRAIPTDELRRCGLDALSLHTQKLVRQQAQELAARGNRPSTRADEKLLRAAANGEIEHAKRWLARGASVEATDSEGRTPLLLAARAGATRLVALLLDHSADVSALDAAGGTALHAAAYYGRVGVARELLDRGASPHDANECGDTPLLIISRRGDEPMRRLLLGRKAETGARDRTIMELAHGEIAALMRSRHATR